MTPIFDLIGNTPLIKLENASKIAGATILGKCEFLNPCGSVKDRAGAFILSRAIERGDLKSGDTMIEATAGNTGIALVLLANALGIKSVIVMPETQAQAKKDALRNLGAELILTPACPLSDPQNFRNTAERLAKQNSWFLADQFNNLDNRDAHIHTTVPEITAYLEQHNIPPQSTGFICSAGTGGTIGGCAMGLNRYNPHIKIGLVDPDGANLYAYYTRGVLEGSGTSFMEGIGQGMITPHMEHMQVDYAYNIADKDALHHAYDAIQQGVNVGLSSALNIAGAIKMAQDMRSDNIENPTVITVLCDTSDKYKEKMFDPHFLTEHGITPPYWLGV